ncbi:MAG TPA: ATP-binding protein [Thermodesulfovibrionales bacterium]|nr:ATP-binding protein [Thermodesulfovibrionales bacterium]
MNRPKHWRGYSLVSGIFIIIIASVIMLNISFQQTLQMESAEQFNKQQLLLANTAALEVQQYVDVLKSDLLSVAELMSEFQIRTKVDFVRLTQGVLRDMGNVKTSIAFLNPEGRVLFSRGNLAAEGTDADEITRTAERLCPNTVRIIQDSKRLHIVAPVCRSAILVGNVSASIDIQDIARKFLGPIKSGSRGYAWMMNDKGDLLHHPTQPDMVGRNLYKTNSSCFKCHKAFDVERKIIEGKADFYGRHVAPSGEDKVLAFSTASIGDSKWIVAVSAPYSEVTLSIRKSMRSYSSLMIAVFLITGLVSVMGMLFYRKKMKAAEIERHQNELEEHARDLEHEVAKRTEELSDEKEKLNTILSAMGSGIVLFNTQGKIQWINETMKKMAGKDITGMFCEDICRDCTIVGSCTVDEVQTEIVTNLFGKKDRYFQVTTAPVKGSLGDLHGHIRLVQDVTDMKKMEEQMMHSEKLAALARLTAGIAQEMSNTPTSVFSLVGILREMELDEFKKESLETVYFHMKRISDVLKQLSGFSMTHPEEFRRWRVNSLIESSLLLIQYDNRAKDVIIVRDLRPDIPEMLTDGNQLSLVIVNIVLNAMDAMPEGGTLTIRTGIKNDRIAINIEDTGTGIPEENLGRIFEPFYSTKNEGTGLGLAVCNSIIRRLNGDLTVESEVNKGSKFVISFPVDVIR